MAEIELPKKLERGCRNAMLIILAVDGTGSAFSPWPKMIP
jgi:hypothetical protein